MVFNSFIIFVLLVLLVSFILQSNIIAIAK